VGARERLIVCVVVAVAAVLAAWFLLLSPERSKLANVNSRIATQQNTLASEQGQLAAGETARNDYKPALHAVAVLRHAAPLSDEVPALIRLINRLEKGHRINWRTVGLSPTSADGLPALTLSFEFASGYVNLQRFVAAFDRLTESNAVNVLTDGRLATISAITLAPGAAGGSVTATVTVTVYQTAATASATGSSSTISTSG